MGLPINTAAAGPVRRPECKGFAGSNLERFGFLMKFARLVINGSMKTKTGGRIGIRSSMAKRLKNEAEG